MADDPVEPLPTAPPVLATRTSIWPSRSAWGPLDSLVTSCTVMPAAPQAVAIAAMVAASLGLGA